MAGHHSLINELGTIRTKRASFLLSGRTRRERAGETGAGSKLAAITDLVSHHKVINYTSSRGGVDTVETPEALIKHGVPPALRCTRDNESHTKVSCPRLFSFF
jgi:hypothetical protein